MSLPDILLKDNNLYTNGRIITFKEGDEMLERDPLVIEASEDDRWHTVTDGDRSDLISYTKYKDQVPDSSKYWWVVADANDIENPLDLSEYRGLDFLIPDILRVRLEL